ncbi:hypothetical protein D3C87_989300 [compost metagenome]
MSPNDRLSAMAQPDPLAPPLTLIRTPFGQVRDSLRRHVAAGDLDMHEASRIVTECVRHWGREATIEALRAERLAAGAAELPTLVKMIQVLGEDPDLPPLPPQMRQGLVHAARELAAELEDGEMGAWELAVHFLEMPLPTRPAVWEGLRRHASEHPGLKTLAFMLLLFPIDAVLRQQLEQWVANEGGAAGEQLIDWLLQTETDPTVQARLRQRLLELRNRRHAPDRPRHAVEGIPLDWPVIAAFVGPEFEGVQDLYVVRQRPEGGVALFMGRMSGPFIEDACGNPCMSEAEYRDCLADLRQEGPLLSCAPVEVLRRIESGAGAVRSAGYPTPFGFQVARYLLAGA